MARQTFRIEEEIPPKEEDRECDRCDNKGARDFVGEWLCDNCILDDVFDEMNERDN
jgi:hypothetical protein